MTLAEQMKAWSESAKDARFFGKSVDAMDREEMLAMIGFLIKDQERSRAEAAERLRFTTDIMRSVPLDAFGSPLNSGIGKTAERRV